MFFYSNTPTSPISMQQKEDVSNNDVMSGGEDIPINPGNGSVVKVNNVGSNGNGNSTFKSPPHHSHPHPNEQVRIG